MKNNILTINVIENKIIQNQFKLMVLKKKLEQTLLNQLSIKKKKSYVEERFSEDILKFI